MKDENPYRSPTSTNSDRPDDWRRREPLRTINGLVNALWGLILGGALAASLVEAVPRAYPVLRAFLVFTVMFGCAAMGVWIGNLVRRRTRLPPFRIRRRDHTTDRYD